MIFWQKGFQKEAVIPPKSILLAYNKQKLALQYPINVLHLGFVSANKAPDSKAILGIYELHAVRRPHVV